MSAEKAPCPEHPNAGRYSNGACKQHAIEAQQVRYQVNKEEAKAYAREYAKRNPRRMSQEAKDAYNAKRKAARAAAKK